MSLLDRTHLLTALLAGLVTTAVPTIAAAQPDPGEEPPAETPEDVELDDDDDDDDDGEAIPPPVEEGGSDDTWGVGGKEPEGRFKPRGRTGKLKELEEDEEEEREVEEGPPDLPPAGFAYVDTVIGTGDILVVSQGTGATNIAPTASFVIGVGYRIGDVWQIFARFPISTNESDGPRDPFPPDQEGARNPDQFTQIATGNLEIGVKPHFILSRDMRLPVGLALAFPSATGDQFAPVDDRAALGKRIVNLAAGASRGWDDRALFASKRFGITPSAGLLWKIRDVGPGNIRLEPETKIEIMIKTGGADPPPEDPLPSNITEVGEFNDVAVNWVLNLDAWYDLFDDLLQIGVTRFGTRVGNAEEVFVQRADPRDTVLDPSGFQFVWEPAVGSHIDFTGENTFGMDFRLSYMIPLGGPLGGGGNPSASIGGGRIRAGFFF